MNCQWKWSDQAWSNRRKMTGNNTSYYRYSISDVSRSNIGQRNRKRKTCSIFAGQAQGAGTTQNRRIGKQVTRQMSCRSLRLLIPFRETNLKNAYSHVQRTQANRSTNELSDAGRRLKYNGLSKHSIDRAGFGNTLENRKPVRVVIVWDRS